ncbi:hypothetical protein ACFQ40_12620 [Kroppenstedtia eburnea]|uniref:hypothetical protein n=1 Tax=Kroppenstedtia eburnea TaxID=714067 RepID=UPI00363BEABA
MGFLIEKLSRNEPINAKGKFIKKKRLDTRHARTPESIGDQVKQVVKHHGQEGASRKGAV